MIAAVHQPNFLPWLGYFYKMLKCDRFVLLDDVQYNRRSITSRVKIKTQNGDQWLTVPVKKKGRYHQLIAEVELEPGSHWKNKVLGTLQTCYGKSPYFYDYFPGIEAIIQKDHLRLSELNIELIEWLALQLEIETPMSRSSGLHGIAGQSTERLAAICQTLGAEDYLSGFGGQKYQEEEIFRKKNIRLILYEFKHPEYTQMWGEFVPGLSTVDLLFNCGRRSAGILKSIK
jgi:hypothetical protein